MSKPPPQAFEFPSAPRSLPPATTSRAQAIALVLSSLLLVGWFAFLVTMALRP